MILSEQELKKAERNLHLFDPEQKARLLVLLEEREKERKLQEARDHFLPFVKMVWPDFIPGAHHTIMADAFERVASGQCTRLIINMPPRHKLLTTLDIPTVSGWKTMAEIQPGDYVFSPDGKPVLVTGKSAVYRERIYEVETDDGCVIETDAEHLWSVRFRSELDGPAFKIRSSKQILDRMNNPNKGVNNTPKLPSVQPVQYPRRDLLIDPYVLGAWLGDGDHNSGTMAAHPADAPHIRARFDAAGTPTTTTKWDMTFGTIGLRKKLKALNVWRNKHIPEDYLTASVEQRLALLQGLMDTDGSVGTDAKCVFYSSSRLLVDQVTELIRSFGVKAHVTERQTNFREYVSKPSWRVNFKMAGAASLPRKAERTRVIRGNKARIISVRETDRFADVQCIEVANDDGLFLAGRGYVPTHNTKSELTSWLLPAWFLGKFPKKKIIQASNTESLAAGFGRRVRNLIDGEDLGEHDDRSGTSAYENIFKGIKLAKDSKAAAGWHTNKGGEYFAIGVNGKVTGKGGDIVIIDDPHSEQEAKQAESSPEIFDGVYSWYNSGPRQRLQPGGAIIIVMCMTGDTPVLRPDGTETPLRNLRPGDEVATYENGAVTSARVVNFRSNGVDDIYTIQTQSGRLLRANARHPFLVDLDGDHRWVRLQNLTPGMKFVALKDAVDRQDRKRDQEECADLARPKLPIIENTRKRLIDQWGSTVSGKVSRACNAETGPREHKGCAAPATRNDSRHANVRRKKLGTLDYSTGTESASNNTTQWSPNETTAATYAGNILTAKTRERIGTVSFASIISTAQKLFADFFVTIAISLLATGKSQRSLNAPPRTSDFTTDEIVSVAATGREEVFDVEIERTENFIANGVVSHNTRWSKRDLTGQVLKKMQAESNNPDTDKWEVIEFPAILDEDTPTERSLWPAYWPLKTLKATKSVLPVHSWRAQYGQDPTSEGAAIIKREYWRKWGVDTDDDQKLGKSSCPNPNHVKAWHNLDPPACIYTIGSWDCAATAKTRSHPSAYTLWGIFEVEDPIDGKVINNIILLSAFKDRLEFPALKKKAKEFYDEDQPDTLLVENKSAGMQLIQEFRAAGLPVEDFSGSSRGTKTASNDKIARANSVSDVFASRYVWHPERRFAEEVIEQCAEFPNGQEDDLVDSTVQALIRFRQGGFIRTQNDEDEEEHVPRRKRRYY